MSDDKPIGIMVSKAPDDPKERDAWAKQMMRIQVAMWVDGKTCCAECGHVYSSVDDFLRCNPKSGGLDKQKNMIFVCSGCWNEYSQKTKQSNGEKGRE